MKTATHSYSTQNLGMFLLHHIADLDDLKNENSRLIIHISQPRRL